MAAFEIRRLVTSCKINSDQTVGFHVNNLDCKVLIFEHRFNISVRRGGKKFCNIFRSSILDTRVEG